MAEAISNNINEVSAVNLKKATDELGDNGFQLNLSIPKLKLELGVFNASDLLVSGLTSERKTKKSKRRKDSIWGKFCGVLGTDDWGWEKYKYQETTYQVDTTKIHQSVLNQLEAYKKDHTTQFQDYLKREFEPTIAEHINGLTNYLARYRDLLISSKKTNQLAQDDKKKLSHEMSLLINKKKMQANDIKVVENSLG